MDSKKTTLLILALNEEDNLPSVMSRIPDEIHEVILVDGNSTDNTVPVARKMRPDIRIVYQSGKGKGNAMQCGFREAIGDIIITIDADGSMDPTEIPRFVEPLYNGSDYVKGSRFIKGGGSDDMPLHRVFGNKLFVSLVNRLFRTRYTDLCYGYNAFKRRSIEKLHIESDGFEIETEMHIKAHKAGFNVTEVPSYEAARLSGAGNLKSFSDGFKIMKTILKERINGNGYRPGVYESKHE